MFVCVCNLSLAFKVVNRRKWRSTFFDAAPYGYF